MAQESKTLEDNYYIYVLDLREPYRDLMNWNEDVSKIAQDHLEYFIKLEKEGKLLIAGRTKYEVSNSENFGIMIFSASSDNEAEVIRKNDPGVKGELMNAKLHPFSIAVLKEKGWE